MGIFKKKIEENIETKAGMTPQPVNKKPVLPQEDTPTGKKTLIGNSFSIKGTVRANEEIYINGSVEGKILSKSKVIVGEKGNVKADIEADEILIKGQVTGDVKGLTKVEVFYKGYLRGNIVSKSVVIAEGANFKGNIDMSL